MHLASRSGLFPLVQVLGAEPFFYRLAWERLQGYSWTLGQWVRLFGNRYYGSNWNALVPLWDEWRILKSLPRDRTKIVHYLWAEFAHPKRSQPYRRKQAMLIGTFHASAQRQVQVLRDPDFCHVFDWITLMSVSQKPFFLERGYAEERMRVILHGVDTDYFTPGPKCRRDDSGPLRGLLVGETERNHAFAANVMRRLPAGTLTLDVCTSSEQWELYYRDVPHVRRMPWLNDAQLVEAYRHADLLLIPLLGCAANNVILEAMACGTPVMANQVGGVMEYISPSSGFIMKGLDVEEWCEVLIQLVDDREQLEGMRAGTRAWAEHFDWNIVADDYKKLYAACMES